MKNNATKTPVLKHSADIPPNASDLKWDVVVKHFQGTDNSQIKN